MPRASHVIRRVLQSILIALTLLGLGLHFAFGRSDRLGLTVAALFATLFALSVAGEAYSRWWEQRHASLRPSELAALRNRTALYLLCSVMAGLLLLIVASARGIPLQLLPLFAGVIALFQFARSVGKK